MAEQEVANPGSTDSSTTSRQPGAPLSPEQLRKLAELVAREMRREMRIEQERTRRDRAR